MPIIRYRYDFVFPIGVVDSFSSKKRADAEGYRPLDLNKTAQRLRVIYRPKLNEEVIFCAEVFPDSASQLRYNGFKLPREISAPCTYFQST